MPSALYHVKAAFMLCSCVLLRCPAQLPYSLHDGPVRLCALCGRPSDHQLAVAAEGVLVELSVGCYLVQQLAVIAERALSPPELAAAVAVLWAALAEVQNIVRR